MISLIDFRHKNHNINDLIPDYNFNFNEVILIDNFQYVTLSPHKISLFDLRYPSLHKKEKVLNINYKELSVKKNKNDTTIAQAVNKKIRSSGCPSFL